MHNFKQPLRWTWLAMMVAILIGAPLTHAQSYSQDLFIGAGDVRIPDNVILGSKIRIYVSVHNGGSIDLAGVVKFYDERTQSFMGPDQPVSALAGATDDVYMDWTARDYGEHPISVRIIPWQEALDNPNNNKITKTIFIDKDSDGDGIGDRVDPDDDNDGTLDSQDAFAGNPNESADTDNDGIGNNTDPDDDNDGTQDAQDAFPTDKNESKDTDGDKIGDRRDSFPADPTENQDSDQDGLGDNQDPNNANKGPVPVIEAERTRVTARKILTFNALRSRDADGSVSSYSWDFGDGKTADTVLAEHAFAKSGLYTVTLTVTDDKNESRATAIEIRVTSRWQIPGVLLLVIFLLLFLRKHTLMKRHAISPYKPALKVAPKKTLRKKKK